MSGNKLEDKIFFNEGYQFGYLPNLTVLELDRNSFTKLPVDALVQHTKLKRLDVAFNQLPKYYPELTEQVKAGMDVEFQGKQTCISATLLKMLTQPLIFRKSAPLQLFIEANFLLVRI